MQGNSVWIMLQTCAARSIYFTNIFSLSEIDRLATLSSYCKRRICFAVPVFIKIGNTRNNEKVVSLLEET